MQLFKIYKYFDFGHDHVRFEIPIRTIRDRTTYLIYRNFEWRYKTDDSDWGGDDDKIVGVGSLLSKVYRKIFPTIFEE